MPIWANFWGTSDWIAHHKFQLIHMPPHQFWPQYYFDGLWPVHFRFEIFSKQICSVQVLICRFYKKHATLTQLLFPSGYISYMHYFLPALQGVAPNAKGFSVVRPCHQFFGMVKRQTHYYYPILQLKLVIKCRLIWFHSVYQVTTFKLCVGPFYVVAFDFLSSGRNSEISGKFGNSALPKSIVKHIFQEIS